MARPIPDADLNELQAAVVQFEGGASLAQIAEALGNCLAMLRFEPWSAGDPEIPFL
jgi:hypothetical protein